MSEKTLKELGKEASESYRKFNQAAKSRIEADNAVEGQWTEAEIAEAEQKSNSSTFWTAEKMRVENAREQRIANKEKGYYDKAVSKGREFAQANASELHDLAVIEAHLGGVAISVEQPITIGQKIEVHTPEHQ